TLLVAGLHARAEHVPLGARGVVVLAPQAILKRVHVEVVRAGAAGRSALARRRASALGKAGKIRSALLPFRTSMLGDAHLAALRRRASRELAVLARRAQRALGQARTDLRIFDLGATEAGRAAQARKAHVAEAAGRALPGAHALRFGERTVLVHRRA